MATAIITEFSDFGVSGSGGRLHTALAAEPAVTDQTVTFTTTTQSAAFNASTKFVRIYSTVAMNLKFGSNPTATASTQPIPADEEVWRAVVAGDKVAIYDGSS